MRDYQWGLEEEKGEVTKKVSSPKEMTDSDDFNAVEFSGNKSENSFGGLLVNSIRYFLKIVLRKSYLYSIFFFTCNNFIGCNALIRIELLLF